MGMFLADVHGKLLAASLLIFSQHCIESLSLIRWTCGAEHPHALRTTPTAKARLFNPYQLARHGKHYRARLFGYGLEDTRLCASGLTVCGCVQTVRCAPDRLLVFSPHPSAAPFGVGLLCNLMAQEAGYVD